jgi:hypothetical protein
LLRSIPPCCWPPLGFVETSLTDLPHFHILYGGETQWPDKKFDNKFWQ